MCHCLHAVKKYPTCHIDCWVCNQAAQRQPQHKRGFTLFLCAQKNGSWVPIEEAPGLHGNQRTHVLHTCSWGWTTSPDAQATGSPFSLLSSPHHGLLTFSSTPAFSTGCRPHHGQPFLPWGPWGGFGSFRGKHLQENSLSPVNISYTLPKTLIMDWMCVSHKFLCWNPDHQGDGTWGRGL